MFNSNFHVALIVSDFNSVNNFRADFIRCLQSIGCRVSVITPRPASHVLAKSEIPHVSYHYVDVDRSSLGFVNNVLYFLRLMKCARQIRVTHVISFTWKPIVFGSLAFRVASRAKCFAMITGLGSMFVGENTSINNKFILSILIRITLFLNDKVFFQNKDDFELASGIVSWAKRNLKCSVIPGSGVNCDRFSRQPLPECKDLRFLMVARLIRHKGVIEFLEAATLVKRKFPNVQFELVGGLDDNISALTFEELEQYQIQGIVSFRGPVDDVRPFLAKCNVFVLPSYREGTARSILEAMATGRPIIATDVPGCRNLVKDGENGYLVKKADPYDLYLKMVNMVENSALIPQFSEKSRAIACDYFSVERINQSLITEMGLEIIGHEESL